MSKTKKKPIRFEKGDVVRSIHDKKVHVVKNVHWQHYAGGNTSDYTVIFEPEDNQPTPWDKSMNLELVEKAEDCQ